MLGNKALSAAAVVSSEAGQTLFIGKMIEGASPAPTKRTHSFVVPDGVTEISAVCVGPGQHGERSDSSADGGDGGDLRYATTLSVTPGETLTVEVGDGSQGTTAGVYGDPTKILRGATVLLEASNRAQGSSSTISGAIGGGNGGVAGAPTSTNASGGGGAGGYSGAGGGGEAGNGTDYPPSSGGGGAYGGTLSASTAQPGGGVGLMGAGPTGSEYYNTGTQNARNAVGSYGYLDPQNGNNCGFGSGGGGNDSGSGIAVSAGPGACRIVWGNGRSYPSDVANYLPVPAAASEIEIRFYGAVAQQRLCMIDLRDSGNTNFFSGLTAVTGGSSSSFSSISAGQFTLKSWQTTDSTILALLKTTGRTQNTLFYPPGYSSTGLDPADYMSLFIKPSSATALKSITLTSAYNDREFRDPVAGLAVIADGVNITKGIACLRGDYVWDGTYETLAQTITFT